MAHRLVGWNSSYSPRAASKLAHKKNGLKQSMLLILGFAESSNASEPMFAYEDREVPEMKRVVVAPRGRG